MAATSMVHIRVKEEIKARATETLAAMGLSVSDAVRVFLQRVADEQAIPFELRVPNKKTTDAMQELEAGKGVCFDSVEAFMTDLNADD